MTSAFLRGLGRSLRRGYTKLPGWMQYKLKSWKHEWEIRRGYFKSPEPEYAQLHEWVEPGDCVIDVGANVGRYTYRLSDLVGPSGRVVAIEPIPDSFAHLAGNARLYGDNVTLLNVAASNTARISTMTIPATDTGGVNYYQASLTEDGGEYSVLCIPIDQLDLPETVTLAKIDVEGHELEVLQGMEEMLKRDYPVLIVEGRSARVEDWLGRLGYEYTELPDSPNRLFRPEYACRVD